MAVRPLLLYPDPRLRQKALPVHHFDAALQNLAQDLVDTMTAAPGVGITAAHIGVLQRVVVLQLPEDNEPAIYVNPVIVSRSGVITGTEGSVSMPGATESVERAEKVILRYQTVMGLEREEIASGFRAICHQHEVDQLDGIFWLERLSRLKRERLIKKWQKSQP